MHHAIVPVAAATAMLYARLAASRIAPGLGRLVGLMPVMALLLKLTFAIPLYSARGTTAFFFVWLGEFKLLLLASGRGPLDPALRPLPFVFTALLPVKLLARPEAAAKPAATPIAPAIKFAALVAAFHQLRRKDEMHPYAAFALFAVAIYCFLDVLLPCLAAAGSALGMELEPQFDRPYLSASLRDFWGRRWNLMASAALRPAVYDPVRARAGAAAAVVATFLVSGLMHEAVVYYLTFRAPTGRVTAFFALHGACVCAERWCARRCRTRLPRVLATPLVVGFVAATAFSIFFPAIFSDGMDDRYIAEVMSLASDFADAGRRLLVIAHRVSGGAQSPE